MPQPSELNLERTRQIKKLKAKGLKHPQIAEKLNLTPGQISGLLYRDRVRHGALKYKKRTYTPVAVHRRGGRDIWSEENLTEKWEDRKARLAKERNNHERQEGNQA